MEAGGTFDLPRRRPLWWEAGAAMAASLTTGSEGPQELRAVEFHRAAAGDMLSGRA